MKKFILFTILGILVSFGSKSQSIPTYPIPSWNIAVNGQAQFVPGQFSQISNSNPKGKIFINVTVHGASGTHAHVWVYSLDGLNVLGPYTVYAGETLTVEIDDREWGAYVQSESDITVDVWTSFGSKFPSKGITD